MIAKILTKIFHLWGLRLREKFNITCHFAIHHTLPSTDNRSVEIAQSLLPPRVTTDTDKFYIF